MNNTAPVRNNLDDLIPSLSGPVVPWFPPMPVVAPIVDRPQRVPLQVLDLDLSTAQAEISFPITGTLLWAKHASSRNALVTVRFEGGDEGRMNWARGDYIAGNPFSRVYLSWEAQSGETMQLVYAYDPDQTIKQV